MILKSLKTSFFFFLKPPLNLTIFLPALEFTVISSSSLFSESDFDKLEFLIAQYFIFFIPITLSVPKSSSNAFFPSLL